MVKNHGRQTPQIIAGDYDGYVKANFQRWHQAAADVDGGQGFMYTIWRRWYDDPEAFAKLVRAGR